MSYDGKLLAWGDSSYGGDRSVAMVQSLLLPDMVVLHSNALGFLAIERDGRLIGWGNHVSVSSSGFQPVGPPAVSGKGEDEVDASNYSFA